MKTFSATTNLICLLLLGSVISASSSHVTYKENLSLKQLPDGKLIAEFQFKTNFSEDRMRSDDYDILSRSIGQVFQTFDVRELHLTMTQGRWLTDRWGYSKQAAPVGANLVAWINGTNVDQKWRGLINALSGLFCASLNFMEMSVTAEPFLTYLPEGQYGSSPLKDRVFSSSNSDGFQLRVGSLPKEAVCTENLSPWEKLLPCQSKAGLSSLLNGYRVFDGNFQSIGVHLSPSCVEPGTSGCNVPGYEYIQTFTVVLDGIRTRKEKSWSFSKSFDRTLPRTCPLAKETIVDVDLGVSDGYIITPQYSETSSLGRYTYHLDENVRDLNIQVDWSNNEVDRGSHAPVPIRAQRFLQGVGQEKGGLVVEIMNDSDVEQEIVYFESLSWILKVFFSSLQINTVSQNGRDSFNSSQVLKDVWYQPAMDRQRPTMMELKLVLPARSKTTISFDFVYAFIKYTEHHPDANRGFDIGSAVLTLLSPSALNEFKASASGSTSESLRIYTDPVLIRLPTPDFSMPYNVITLTCTIFALFFGSLLNMMTRQYQPIPKKGTVKSN